MSTIPWDESRTRNEIGNPLTALRSQRGRLMQRLIGDRAISLALQKVMRASDLYCNGQGFRSPEDYRKGLTPQLTIREVEDGLSISIHFVR